MPWLLFLNPNVTLFICILKAIYSYLMNYQIFLIKMTEEITVEIFSLLFYQVGNIRRDNAMSPGTIKHSAL